MADKTASNKPANRLFGEPSHSASHQPGKSRPAHNAEKVECLGMTFDSDDARRTYFRERLREKLADPQLRAIQGFPTGEIDAIIELSDPPFFTACPNPFVADFVRMYGKSYTPASDNYQCEPFATDVSEGKNDPIYSAHSYHTKVPHKAIMRYILHYTKPGDIVFDGFCGTGMTGVAAQMCGDREAVKSLGLTLSRDGTISDDTGTRIGALGIRKAVLSDLSPFAGFVAASYNDFSPAAIESAELAELLDQLDAHWGEFFKTRPPKLAREVDADFYVWSDCFSCSNCGHIATLFEFAVKKGTHDLAATFDCPKCDTELTKDSLERVWTKAPDANGRATLKSADYRLVEVVTGSTAGRYSPGDFDRDLIERIQRKPTAWFPDAEFPHGRQTRKIKSGSGIIKVHQMFTPRALRVTADAWERVKHLPASSRKMGMFLVSSALKLASRMERYRDGTGKGSQSGTLYVPSLQIEKHTIDVLRRKQTALAKVPLVTRGANACVLVQSHGDLRNLPENSIDYIFTDPPFGESLQYGELNFFHEAWLKVFTSLKDDCVLNYVHDKGLAFYREMMTAAFREAKRALKPGRWVTVEFHNSQNSVWAAVQEALNSAGLVVADVRVLNKEQATFNAVNRAGAVDKDLAISAYKPTSTFEASFEMEGGTEAGVWDFTRAHLKQLPVWAGHGDSVEPITERQAFLLFDRMVAFHVQRGISIPISAGEFYAKLNQRFIERDAMYFLPEQAADYDRRRARMSGMKQLQLFVTDEASAIQWIRQQLGEKPQTFKELQPQFMKEIAGWEKHERPLELLDLLRQNFICYDGDGQLPSQIHAYLSSNFKELRNLSKSDAGLREKATDRWYVPDPNKAGDLEKLREKALLKEFEEYRTQKKLKVFRTEAVRGGFKSAYDRQDYKTIVEVAQKLPESVLQEDEKLLMYFDVATMRLGDEDKDKLFR